MRKLLVANWKLHPGTQTEAIRLAKASDQRGVVICPPFPFLDSAGKTLKKAELGSQDVFWEEQGPYTGEVSSAMLKNMGARYVIIGHSERRRWQNETDALIAQKVRAALFAGLKVILCVGEPAMIRKRGLAAAKNFVKSQLQKDLAKLKAISYKPKAIVVAYEPIWAIGTGKPDKPPESAAMAKFIKNYLAKSYKLKARVLYGGSVNSKNVLHFLTHKEIDGALVGGASLNTQDFRKMMRLVL